MGKGILNKKNILRYFTKDIISLSIIFALTFIVCSNIFSVPLLYDDIDFLINWKAIRSFTYVPDMLLGATPDGHAGVYRPIRGILYIVGYHLFGFHLFFYHLLELAIYFLCIYLVYLITKQLSKNHLVVFFTTLTFALLPIHIDNTANLTAAFDTAGVVFFFLAFYLFQLFLHSKCKNKRYFYVSLLSALIAGFTYEITLILPLLILLYAYYKKQKMPWHIAAPYFIPVVLYIFVRFILFHVNTRGTILDNLPVKTGLAIKNMITFFILSIFPLPHVEANASNTFGFLLMSKVKEPAVAAINTFNGYFYASLVILITMASLSWYRFTKRSLTAFGILWFFISYIPAFAISVQSSSIFFTQVLWSRYMFIGTYGLSLSIGAWAAYGMQAKPRNAILQYFKTVGVISFCALLFFYGYVYHYNISKWRDFKPELIRTIKQNKESEYTHNDLGVVFASMEKYDQAIMEFKKSLSINPKYSRARQNLDKLCNTLKEHRHILLQTQSCSKQVH